jgi:hypothetical protein
MKRTFGKLALGLALGAVGVLGAGCHSGPGASATASSAPAATASAAYPVGSPAHPAGAPAAAPGTSAPASPVGVVADCARAEPFPLSTKPASIVLACADDGVRVEGLTWAEWTPAAARGHGTLRENQCVPNCAEGKSARYPVTVTLFAVEPSSQGPWFSRLTITWGHDRPPNQTPSTFTLEAPGSPPMPA